MRDLPQTKPWQNFMSGKSIYHQSLQWQQRFMTRIVELSKDTKICLIDTIKRGKEASVTQWRMMKLWASGHVSLPYSHVSRVKTGHRHTCPQWQILSRRRQETGPSRKWSNEMREFEIATFRFMTEDTRHYEDWLSPVSVIKIFSHKQKMSAQCKSYS